MAKKFDDQGKRLRKSGGPWRGKSAKRELPADELASYQKLIFQALDVGLEGQDTDYTLKEDGFAFRRIIQFEAGVTAVVSVRITAEKTKAEIEMLSSGEAILRGLKLK